jgi:hypothetical protein
MYSLLIWWMYRCGKGYMLTKSFFPRVKCSEISPIQFICLTRCRQWVTHGLKEHFYSSFKQWQVDNYNDLPDCLRLGSKASPQVIRTSSDPLAIPGFFLRDWADDNIVVWLHEVHTRVLKSKFGRKKYLIQHLCNILLPPYKNKCLAFV